MRKKGIYILVATALLAWSCGREELPAADSSRPIAFSMPATKADTYTYLPSETSFTVAARKSSGSTWSGTGAANVFKTTNGLQNVQTTNGAGACAYSPAAYWSGNSVFRFRAVYPIAPDLVNYTDDLNGNAVISNFSVNASASAQKDLMLSDMVERTLTTVGNPDPVDIVFHHLLCKVIFKINEDTSALNDSLDVFTITGVKLNGLPDRGTYTGTATSGTWSTLGAQGLTCINNTNYDIDNDGAYTTVFDGLLLIPMTITNQVNMVLDYKVSHNGGEATTKSAVISIPAISWEAGKVYTYQLSMSEEYYIKFGNITVDTWGSTQASGSVIIK